MGVILKEETDEPKTFIYPTHIDWEGSKLTCHAYYGSRTVDAMLNEVHNNPQRIVWAGDYADPESTDPEEKNLFDICYDSEYPEITEYKPSNAFKMVMKKRGLYLCNKSKMEYVDLYRDGLRQNAIHPLPLLTAEGNTGQNGGDYYGRNMKMVGSWARDLIFCTAELPEGYKEIRPNFKENMTMDEEKAWK